MKRTDEPKTKLKRGDMFQLRYFRVHGESKEIVVLLKRRYYNHGKIRAWWVWNMTHNINHAVLDLEFEDDQTNHRRPKYLGRPEKP